MSLDVKVKKNVTELINKERDVSIGSLPARPDMSTQDHLKKSKELMNDAKKQVETALRKGNSVMLVVVSY